MDKLQVNIILEILGRPPQNILDALKGLVSRLGSEKGTKIIDQVIHEPLPVKDSKDLYTSFVELTLELDSLENYFGILFAYMPSNIELISPERISLKNDELNLLANKLALRLHDYDALAKRIVAEKEILVKKLHEIAPDELQKLIHPPQKKEEPKIDKDSKKKTTRKNKKSK